MRRLVPILAVTLLFLQVTASRAATFAQFIQQNKTATGFVLNGGTAGLGTLSQEGSSLPIFFQFGAFANSSLLNKNINATLTLKATTSDNATPGPTPTQDFNHVTWVITANGTQVINGVTIANGANLLTGTSGYMTGTANVGGTISGAANGNSATFSGSDVNTGDPSFFNTVTYTSDFINFTGATNKAYAYAFSSVNPMYFVDGTFPNQFIGSFTAQGAGTFSAVLTAVPEPGSISLAMSLCCGGGLFFWRRRRSRA